MTGVAHPSALHEQLSACALPCRRRYSKNAEVGSMLMSKVGTPGYIGERTVSQPTALSARVRQGLQWPPSREGPGVGGLLPVVSCSASCTGHIMILQEAGPCRPLASRAGGLSPRGVCGGCQTLLSATFSCRSLLNPGCCSNSITSVTFSGHFIHGSLAQLPADYRSTASPAL